MTCPCERSESLGPVTTSGMVELRTGHLEVQIGVLTNG